LYSFGGKGSIGRLGVPGLLVWSALSCVYCSLKMIR
jgi:hypothetical protein